MPKDTSAKIMPKKTKKDCKKRQVKDIKIFLKKKKKRSDNMFVKNIKIAPHMKNKCWLSIAIFTNISKRLLIKYRRPH